MFAYCNNNPVSRADPTGRSWNDFCEFFKTVVSEIGNAIKGLAPAYASCGGIAVADGPLPFGDAVALIGAGAITIGAAVYGIGEAISAPAISIEEEKAATIRTSAYYFGCRKDGDGMEFLTPAMTFEVAAVWAQDIQRRSEFGKGTAWGLYTDRGTDAYTMAYVLGAEAAPVWHVAKKIGYYDHFHVNEYTFMDYFEHFHIWYALA